MKILGAVKKFLLPEMARDVFSERAKEVVAMRSAARFSRGNINIQMEHVTTEGKFEKELMRMAARAAK